MVENYGLYDIVQMKCEGCGAVVMMERPEFERKCKKIIQKAENNDQSTDI